jgi:hypothetical protein
MYKQLLGLSLALLAFPAFAGDISYNYVELGYQKIDIDDPGIGEDVDGDGFGANGSFEMGDSWFFRIGYSQADFDFGIDLDEASAGLGWHTTMSNNADIYALIQYVRAEASISGFPGSVDEDGVGAEIGVRGMVSDKVELAGSIAYVDLGDAGDGTSFGAQVLYSFTENFAAGLFLDLEEDATGYGAGVRFYW